MMNKDFTAQLKSLKRRSSAHLQKIIPKSILGTSGTSFIQSQNLCQAMRYSALASGKRIRPIIVYATGLALGAPLDRLDYAASAIELIHAGSLVHDDLPAMDDDDLRRGLPTNHRVFGEATAILAGTALQCYAYEVLAEQAGFMPARKIVAMTKVLAHAHGSQGIMGGQNLDLVVTSKKPTIDELKLVHRLKTGALISAAVKLGILASIESDTQVIETLQQFADIVGLGFQVIDDILDITSSTTILGKPNGSDINNDKTTYPSLVGLAQAKQIAHDLHNEAMTLLAPFGQAFDFLRFITDYLLQRVD